MKTFKALQYQGQYLLRFGGGAAGWEGGARGGMRGGNFFGAFSLKKKIEKIPQSGNFHLIY